MRAEERIMIGGIMKKLLRKIRKVGYPILKYTGDAEAVMRGTIFRRVGRRIMGISHGCCHPPEEENET